MNLKPLGDRLLVKPIEQEEKTASGIILPETAKEKPQEGEVLAVGPGSRKEDGDRIAMDVPWATACCTPSTLAPRSRWTASSTSSCARVTCWPSSEIASWPNAIA